MTSFSAALTAAARRAAGSRHAGSLPRKPFQEAFAAHGQTPADWGVDFAAADFELIGQLRSATEDAAVLADPALQASVSQVHAGR